MAAVTILIIRKCISLFLLMYFALQMDVFFFI